MNEQLRNAIGKAFFDQIVAEEWEEQTDDFKELYRGMAEKVVEVYKNWMDANSGGMLRLAGIDEIDD